MGDGYVLLTAPHASETEADLYTGHLVEDSALTARCCAVVGKIGREYSDLDRVKTAQSDFEKSIASMVQEYGIQCLLEVLGKRQPGVDVLSSDRGTVPEITNLVKTRLSKDFAVSTEPQNPGVASAAIPTVSGDESTRASLNHMRLRFGEQEINHQRDMVVTDIAELVAIINRHLGFKEDSDERL